MQERLVDVINSVGNVIHTYPISLGASESELDEARYEAKALEAACFGRLVSDAELASLSATMHVARSGPMEPYGDSVSVMAETPSALMQIIREQAYFLWKNHGDEHRTEKEDWLQAREQLLRERAYTLREEDGRPESRTDEHWLRTQSFESC